MIMNETTKMSMNPIELFLLQEKKNHLLKYIGIFIAASTLLLIVSISILPEETRTGRKQNFRDGIIASHPFVHTGYNDGIRKEEFSSLNQDNQPIPKDISKKISNEKLQEVNDNKKNDKSTTEIVVENGNHNTVIRTNQNGDITISTVKQNDNNESKEKETGEHQKVHETSAPTTLLKTKLSDVTNDDKQDLTNKKLNKIITDDKKEEEKDTVQVKQDTSSNKQDVAADSNQTNNKNKESDKDKSSPVEQHIVVEKSNTNTRIIIKNKIQENPKKENGTMTGDSIHPTEAKSETKSDDHTKIIIGNQKKDGTGNLSNTEITIVNHVTDAPESNNKSKDANVEGKSQKAGSSQLDKNENTTKTTKETSTINKSTKEKEQLSGEQITSHHPKQNSVPVPPIQRGL